PAVAVSLAPGHGLPESAVELVMEELEGAAAGGGTLGFPLMRVKATVLGGVAHETDSSEIAWRTAASLAFDKGLREAGLVLLEPVMALELTTPDDHVGDLVNDLQQRRAIIHRTEQRGAATVLVAEAPLANLFGYSSAMRSLSQGRAGCSMSPSGYSTAPDDVVQRFLGE
ncbi:MAG: elongation factor G, partial [Lacipirellulaceae bacterium]